MTDMRNNKSQMAETETNNTKTLKEIFSEEIRAELASGRTKKPTFEEFKEMVEKEKSKRRKKYTAIAACFVAALVVGFFAFDYMACDVGADKNPKEIIQTEDGVIIEDGGWGSSVGEENVWIVKERGQIEDVKQIFPQLLVPQYIPSRYTFSELKIEVLVESDIVYEYQYVDKNNAALEIEILSIAGGTGVTEINDANRMLNSSNGNIYVQGGEADKRATIEFNGGPVAFIWGSITDSELIKVIEGLKD